MKLPTPSAPFSPVYVHGESITIETEGKVLVLPSGNPNILPLNNEYTLNSNRLSIAESPFGGLKGSGSPDYCVGTVNIIEGDGVYLHDVSGTNSSKTLSAGKLKELNLLSVDTTNHSITEEFVVANTSVSNNPTVISDGTTIEGWSAGTGALTSLTTENGRIKAVGRGTISVGFKIIKTVSLAGKQFLTFKIECNTTKNLFVSIAQGANKIEFRGTRFPIPANTVTSFVLPIHAPAGTEGLYPSTVSGTIDWSNDVTLYIGTDQKDESDITFYLDDIHADVARQTTLEIQTPDNLANTSLQLYTHNGTAYQLCSTHSLDGAYSQVSQTSTNCTFLDGTKLDDVYGTGAGRAVFPKGSAGATVKGSSGSITYSNNLGTDKRIGLKVDLPPSDNRRTNFNKVRAKLVINYTDTVGNIVPDLSGNGNHGTIVGGVTKLNEGGLKFDGSTGYVNCGNPTALNTNNFTIITTVIPTTGGYIYDKNVSTYNNGEYLIQYDLNYQRVLSSIDYYASNITSPSNSVPSGVSACIVQRYDSSVHSLFINNVKYTVDYSATRTHNSSNFVLGARNINSGNFGGTIQKIRVYNRALSDTEVTAAYNNQYVDPTGLVISYDPTPINMGAVTYELSNDNSASTGLQNLSKPWIALYDPTSNLIDFYLFTHRPKNLEFRRDESGNIYELVLYPGNGLIYHGQITYPDLTLDSDSNLIPNFLEESIEGSLTKFLKPYGMVI
jgi:hypothetical protein